MNNLLKSAARKHALARGIATSKWTDEDFLDYTVEHGITERDNLKNVAEKLESTETVKVAHTQEETAQAISEGQQASVDAAIRALIASTQTKSALDEERVVELVREHSRAPRTVNLELTKTDGKKVTVEGCHKELPTVLAMINAKVDVCVVGPAGSGKSTMFEQIAESLELDYYFQGAVQQEHKILGYQDANGTYHRTQFRDAYENGGLFVFEEFDGSSARALLAINNAVAGQWADFPDGKIARHSDFICVMAGNTYGTGASRQYVGRQQLDAATLDRFAFHEVGYDEAMERKAALAFFEGADTWVTEVQSFRKKVEAAGVRHVVSPRASIMGAKMLKAGVSHEVAVSSLLHKGLSADQLAQLAG